MADGDEDDEVDDEFEADDADEEQAGELLGFNNGGELLAGPTIIDTDWLALEPEEHH